MYPIHDFDALLMLATALASKRRPATLLEIMAASDVLERIPPESKLGEAFHRLAMNGLLRETEGAYSLTPAGEKVVSGIRPKAEKEERLEAVKENLNEYKPVGEHAPIIITSEQFTTAFAAHRAAAKTPVINVLMPRPKKDSHFKVDGQWRRVAGTRGTAKKTGARGR